MRRRDFIAAFGVATVIQPLSTQAQQPGIPVIGFLRSARGADPVSFMAALRQGLKEAGFVEGQNVAIETFSAAGQPDRLQDAVADMLRRPVAVIVANQIAALAAKAATATVPIVFTSGFDPVQVGLVASVNRPGAATLRGSASSRLAGREKIGATAPACAECHDDRDVVHSEHGRDRIRPGICSRMRRRQSGNTSSFKELPATATMSRPLPY